MSNSNLRRRKEKIRSKVENNIYQNITKPQNWGNSFGKTRRKNGQIIEGGFRDIVDQGVFRDSFDVFWRGNDLVFTSTAPHFRYVVDGYFTRSGNFIEGRQPWDENQIKRLTR